MQKKIAIANGSVKNGAFIVDPFTVRTVTRENAREIMDKAKKDVIAHIERIGGKQNMMYSHIVAYSANFNNDDELVQVFIPDNGRDMTDADFDKFQRNYGYVFAYHR